MLHGGNTVAGREAMPSKVTAGVWFVREDTGSARVSHHRFGVRSETVGPIMSGSVTRRSVGPGFGLVDGNVGRAGRRSNGMGRRDHTPRSTADAHRRVRNVSNRREVFGSGLRSGTGRNVSSGDFLDDGDREGVGAICAQHRRQPPGRRSPGRTGSVATSAPEGRGEDASEVTAPAATSSERGRTLAGCGSTLPDPASEVGGLQSPGGRSRWREPLVVASLRGRTRRSSTACRAHRRRARRDWRRSKGFGPAVNTGDGERASGERGGRRESRPDALASSCETLVSNGLRAGTSVLGRSSERTGSLEAADRLLELRLLGVVGRREALQSKRSSRATRWQHRDAPGPNDLQLS